MTKFSHLEAHALKLMNHGYHIVPIMRGEKRPNVPGWQNIVATEELAAEWSKNHTGCGILARNTVGVDLDILEPELSEDMASFVRELLGWSPSRVGKAPKQLLPYRCEVPFKKLASPRYRSPDGQEHRVEILADGQQFVAAHIHPGTLQPYLWHNQQGETTECLDIPRNDLPEITEENARKIVDEFLRRCEALGWERIGQAANSSAGEPESFVPLMCPEEEIPVLKEALFTISADDREVWIKIGHALKSQGDTGWPYDLFMEWSATSSVHNPEPDEETWMSFKPTRTDYRVIFAEAQRRGWNNSGNALQRAIKALAKLSHLEYEQVRKEKAKELGLRAPVLDKQVEALRESLEEEKPSPSFGDPVEPWPEPIILSQLLDDIRHTVGRYVVCDEETKIASTLWISMTWVMEHVQVAPIAAITAPEKRCGKTTMLSILGKLVCNPMMASNISPAAIYRVIEHFKPTLLMDEIDTFINEDNPEIRGILNSGHTRDMAYVVRNVANGEDFIPTRFCTWGAKATAGIGEPPETMKDRSVCLRLRRKTGGEKAERLRYAPKDLFVDIQRKLARFAEDYGEAIQEARPDLPDALNDRAQDNWEPLLAIADLAGEDWGRIAREAALKISSTENEPASLATELLRDIQQAFSERGERLWTNELLDYLTQHEERPWATYNHGKPITPSQIAKFMRDFDIASVDIKKMRQNLKGYRLEQFTDAFRRYLPPAQLENAATALPDADYLTDEVADELEGSATLIDGATQKALEELV